MTGMCYFVSRDAVSNWYVAKYNCEQLEVVYEPAWLVRALLPLSTANSKLWIGLRREGWTWDTGKDVSVML